MVHHRISEPVPTNLKERIAALQQRNVSPPSQRAPSPAASLATTMNAPAPGSVAALRDKIAKFEKKGGTPVPRGSFGLGAPPPSENAQQKRRGELYGNRIPSQVTGGSIKLASHTTGGAFPPSSMPSMNTLNNRRFSMSQVEMEGNFDDMLHSSKFTADLTTAATEDPGAKTSTGADTEPEAQGQPLVNSSDEPCRVEVEGSTITTAAPPPEEPTQEAPIVFDTPIEPSQNAVESTDTFNIDEEPSQLAYLEFNYMSVADSIPSVSKNTEIEAPVTQTTNDNIAPPDPTPAAEAIRPELVTSPVLTSEPLAIEEPSPSAEENTPSDVPPSRISTDAVTKPAQIEQATPPQLSESPVQEEESSELSQPTSPPRPQTHAPEPDFDPFSYVSNNPTKSTFSTTIHRKVVESPPRASTVVRVIPRVQEPARVPNIVSVEPPSTPGIGDLSTLMQDAVAWEAILDGGALPEPSPIEKSSESEREQLEVVTKKRVDDARARKQSVRRKRSHGGNSAKKRVLAPTPEPPVPVPLPPVEPFIIPPPDPRPKRSIARDLVPDDSPMTSTPPSSFVKPDQHKLAPTLSREPEAISHKTYKAPSTKSSGGKYRYFASLRRLSNFGSANSRPSTINRAATFNQRSVSSAEDSPILITPSDDSDFGSLKPPRDSEDKRPSSLYNVGRTTKSKNGGGIFRPGSFADKIWRRTRTRSNASSGVSKITSPSAVSLADPSVLPSLHVLDPIGAQSTDTPRPRPKRSSSVASSLTPTSLSPPVISPTKSRLPPSSFAPPPQLPPIPSWAGASTGDSTNTSTTTTSAPLLNLDFSSFSTSMDHRSESTS